MENQHRQIKGYRELSQREIDLMNAVKGEGVNMQRLLMAVRLAVIEQSTASLGQNEQCERERLEAAQPMRWTDIAEEHFQQGLMALTRAVAQPTFF